MDLRRRFGVSGMIIDAHYHLWDPGVRRHAWLDALPSLGRPFGLDDFAPLATAHGVTASVLVQVLPSVAETGEFLAVAASGTVVAGVVGWADLTAPDVRRGLRALAGAGLVYDLLVRPAQLPAAIRVARDLPGVSFVLDHGGKPDIAGGQYEPWASLVGELAACPNVAAKLSGLVTEAGPHWSAALIGPYAGHLIDSFGPHRLMVGSDWPVCTLAASYGEVLDLAVSLLSARLGAADVAGVLAGNARAIYRLQLP